MWPLSIFGKSDTISLTVRDRDIVAMEDYNRKSYVAYRMALVPMPLNDLESQFADSNLAICHTLWTY